jgi:hypothetical protein
MKLKLFLFISLNTLVFSFFSQKNAIIIKKIGNKFQLSVNNQPFYIKGAGGENHLDELVEAGGNTIRTWSTENAAFVLDEAQKKGVKVMLGLWVQHERHGFDYNNKKLIKQQLEGFREEIKKYKNHPALLLWCVGNEYELGYTNTKVWKAVNEIAKMVKSEDPNHPVVSVTAGTNDEKIKFVKRRLKAIDIYGINTYADIGKVKVVLQKAKYNKPYLITEWGPTGHWESPTTSWGVALEQSSKEKSISYYNRYQDYIVTDSINCLGSFAFLWGQKQEYTSTWYGVFQEDGRKTAIVDALSKCWSPEKLLKNEAPILDSIVISPFRNRKDLILKTNEQISFEVFYSDNNSDVLSFSWELYHESTDLKTGGDHENKPDLIKNQIKENNIKKCIFTAPKEVGKYRLFLTISDGEKIAYDNIPILVRD